MNVSPRRLRPSAVDPAAEVEIVTEDLTRPLVSTVETVTRAPLMRDMFAEGFALPPQNAAGRYELRWHDFSRSAAKAVLNQLRTGVGPAPHEMRSDKRADYVRLADYLCLDPTWELTITKPTRVLTDDVVLAVTQHDDHIYYATEREVWRVVKDASAAAQRMFASETLGHTIDALAVHGDCLFIAASLELEHLSEGVDIYSIDLLHPETAPRQQHFPEAWDTQLLELGDMFALVDDKLYAWQQTAFTPCDVEDVLSESDKTQVHLFRAHDDAEILSVQDSYSARTDGKTVKICDNSSGIVLADIHSSTEIHALTTTPYAVFVASEDGAVREYDPFTGQRQRILVTGPLYDMWWCDDCLLTMGSHGGLNVWDLRPPTF